MGDIYGVSDPYHREEGAAEGRWDVVDSQGRISVGGGKNPVGDDLHWKKTGDDGTVGGATSYFSGVYKGEGLLGGRTQEGCMVKTRCGRDTA